MLFRFLILIILLQILSKKGNCQTIEYGTTIITHGFQLSNAPLNTGEWMHNIALAILKKGNNKGCIRVYNKSNGSFKVVKGNCDSGEVILLLDWASDSRIFSPGFSEAAGDAFFAALISAKKNGTIKLNNLHFIGHSRGCVVNTEIAERLLKIGISIDHITNIDPHDWGGGALIGLNVANDWDNHPNLNIPFPKSPSNNNGVIAWKGVNFIDTYWQNTPLLQGNFLNGRAVDGTYNQHWNSYANGHSNIHEIFLKSINDLDLYPDGYIYSRLANKKQRPKANSPYILKYTPRFDFYTNLKYNISKERIRGIMNGSFDRGSGVNIPGWEKHQFNGATNGGGFARIVNEALEIGYNNVGNMNNPSIAHNRFYIPKDARQIKYKRKSQSNKNEILVTKVAGTTIKVDTIKTTETSFKEISIDISNYQDQVITLKFELIRGSRLCSVCKITLDEVRFSNETTSSTLFLFDLSGSMNSKGGNSTLPKLAEAKAASKYTLNQMKNNPSGIAEEVGVLGFKGGCVDDPTIPVSKFETDLSLVETRINSMGAGGGTPLAEAIAVAECKLAYHLQQNKQENGKLIILSDGAATCQKIRPNGVYNSAPLQKIERTISADKCGGGSGTLPNKIKYYTVGFNIRPGTPAERDLQYLAQLSGGKYLNVQNQVQLERAFRKFNRTYIPKENPALKNLSSSANSNFNKGVSQIKSEEFKSALKAWEGFAKRNKQDCHGVYNLALMQEANDFYSLAIESYKKYLTLCPNPSDKEFVEKQIQFLEEEFKQFLLFQKEVLKSDLAYLKLHFEKIQNGQSVALAEEFKGFLKEKGDYYINLPALVGRTEKLFKRNAKEVAEGLNNCAKTIQRNPQTWDRDATPFLSMTYLNLERLINSF